MEKKTYKLEERAIDVYLQKSLKFLYPLLRIVTPTKNLPLNTYLAWNGEVGIDECKLICVYELKEDAEFKQFEKTQLQRNSRFVDYKETEDGKGVYIFTLEEYIDDVLHFYNGRYSLMSKQTKDIILTFYSTNIYSHEYMDSYLNPNKLVPSKVPPGPDDPTVPKELETYFMVYARLMAITKKKGECYLETNIENLKEYEKMLMKIGELCDPYNPDKEVLTAKVLESKLTI